MAPADAIEWFSDVSVVPADINTGMRPANVAPSGGVTALTGADAAAANCTRSVLTDTERGMGEPGGGEVGVEVVLLDSAEKFETMLCSETTRGPRGGSGPNTLRRDRPSCSCSSDDRRRSCEGGICGSDCADGGRDGTDNG